MISDLRFALRSLAKTPGFTLLAVLSLALAIGVNSGMYSIVRGILFRPMTADGSTQVVSVFNGIPEANHEYRPFSYAEYETLSQPNAVFSDLCAMELTMAGLEHEGTLRRSMSFLVTDSYFRVYGGRPSLGRSFNAEESKPGAGSQVVMLSHVLWQRLGGSPELLGAKIRINSQPFTVVGVMPEGFSGGNAIVGPELWLPLGARDLLQPKGSETERARLLSDPATQVLMVIGRLKPGLTSQSAASLLTPLNARFNAVRADSSSKARVIEITPLSRSSLSTTPTSDGSIGTIAYMLLGIAAVVLLVACLNLANMILARNAGRVREFAIRFAVGASRWAIIRLLLIEGLLLSLAGGALGLWISFWGNSLLMASFMEVLSTLHIALVLDLTPDLNVVLATLAFCTLATLLFGLVPALRASRLDVSIDMKPGAVEAVARGRLGAFLSLRHLLIMGQIALSMALIFASGLFFRGALSARRLSSGFAQNGVLVAEFDHSLTQGSNKERLLASFAALDQARGLPGAQKVALTSLVPFSGVVVELSSTAPDGTKDAKGAPRSFSSTYSAVTADYFETIGIRLLAGRVFAESEARDPLAKGVAIIDDNLARSLFGESSALGRRLHLNQVDTDGKAIEPEVVGIVSHFRNDIFADDNKGRIFLPFAWGSSPVFKSVMFSSTAYLQVKLDRSDRDSSIAASQALYAALRRMDADFPLLSVTPLEDMVAKDIGFWVARLGAILFGVCGGIALLLALVGVYGVKAYVVSRRTREIGIRMAIGATKADILRMVMRQGAAQLAIGLAVGLLLALAVGTVLSSALYRVSPRDPVSLVVAALSLCLASVLATWLPAMRAARVNPTEALRND